MSTAPDPSAPNCACCKTNRKAIRETMRRVNAVQIGQGIFWDDQGRKHQHFGAPGGTADYACECGHSWSGAFPATFYPCWCGWPQTS